MIPRLSRLLGEPGGIRNQRPAIENALQWMAKSRRWLRDESGRSANRCSRVAVIRILLLVLGIFLDEINLSQKRTGMTRLSYEDLFRG
jgi:hypothetical protein